VLKDLLDEAKDDNECPSEKCKVIKTLLDDAIEKDSKNETCIC